MTRIFLPFLLLSACSAGGADDTDSDTTEKSDNTETDTTEESDTVKEEVPVEADAEETDAGSLDAYAGTFEAHAPYEACYASFFNQTVVTLSAVDATTFTIADGNYTFTCTFDGTDVTCAQISGATPNVQIGPATTCVWPYTADLIVTDFTTDGFTADLAFQTAPSPSGPTCEAALGACNGRTTATFTRWTPPNPGDNPPVAEAMVSPAN